MTSTARILIIAGSDSGGGAGIQADIKTVTMLGAHATTAITAVTAQNTIGVDSVHPIPAEAILAQIDAIVSDIGVDAVKIGMVPSAFAAEAIANRLEKLDKVPIVFGEGWIGYTPLHGSFEEGPVGSEFCRFAVRLSARVGAWGTIVCSNAAPHHSMWADTELQLACNREFLESR